MVSEISHLLKCVIEKVTDCLLTTDVELNGNESSNDLGKNC